jgi:hypothetical protein
VLPFPLRRSSLSPNATQAYFSTVPHQVVDVPDSETERPLKVQEVAAWLGLNLQEIGLITINGVQSEMQDPLPADCRLCFFPYVSGG